MSLRALKYTLLLPAACFLAGAIFGRPGPAARPRPAATDSVMALPRQPAAGEPMFSDSVPDRMAPDRPGRRSDSLGTAGYVRPAPDPSEPILQPDTVRADTVRKKSFLDDPISGKSTDSLVYDVKGKVVYIYKNGDVKYQTMNMKADFMRVEMDTKELFAYGTTDTLGNKTRPEFLDGGSSYTMDTITYNIDTKKAKIKGVATQEGEGYLIGDNVKKMSDNTINIKRGKYTTCDQVDHPHFYLQMTRAKVIPGKKVIADYSFMVMEDVPIYFPGLPEGFFPMTTGRKSGFIVPSYGEENVKGFFLRDGGYYFAINDYIDLSILGGIYTLGSWEAHAASRYLKRYKFRGDFQVDYSKNKIGEKGEDDYINDGSFQVRWTHQQDPKFRPNSTFSASVTFSSSGYQKYGTNNLNDYLSTQTNSSISYSHTWAGTPFSISMGMQHSQNSYDTTVSISLPNVNFNMQRIFPFRRKNAIGKQRWYEKISMQYTMTMNANATVKERELFTDDMFKKVKTGIQHSIPVQASFNLFNYINVTPSAQYTERWYFRKIEQEWDPVEKRVNQYADTTYGFYRVYNYNVAVSANTKVYGTYQFKSPKFPIQAIRHTLSPTIGFTYAPDFMKQKYGFYQPVQSDEQGNVRWYSPYSNEPYGVPSSGQSMSLRFGLSQTLEMKVLSKSDTSGIKKVKLIDDFSITGSYNFLADSMQLSTLSLSLRSTLPANIGINISATLDPYEFDKKAGHRINRYMVRRGKIGRITSVNWTLGYTFNSTKATVPAINDVNSQPAFADPFYFDPDNPIDPTLRRQMMTATYYDFNIPWNFGFSYTFNYSNPGNTKSVTQSLTFNGSVNLTPKWGLTFYGGYDFVAKKLTPGTVTLTRDLHCWQMNFTWVPYGYRKSWSFNISVKSAMLRDLKYDKQSSFYDNLLDQ